MGASKKKPPKLKLLSSVKRKPGRPPKANKEDMYKTVLRIPQWKGDLLKKAVEQVNEDRDPGNRVSMNSALGTLITVWLKSEGLIQ